MVSMAYGQYFYQPMPVVYQQPPVAAPVQNVGLSPQDQAELQGQAVGLLKELLDKAADLVKLIPDSAATLDSESPSAYGNYVPKPKQ